MLTDEEILDKEVKLTLNEDNTIKVEIWQQ